MISYFNPINMGSSLTVKVVVKDENGVTVQPATSSWSLLDEAGQIVAGRQDVALTPSKSMTVYLRGSDTQLDTGTNFATRTIKVTSTYGAKDGTILDVVESLVFQIQRT